MASCELHVRHLGVRGRRDSDKGRLKWDWNKGPNFNVFNVVCSRGVHL